MSETSPAPPSSSSPATLSLCFSDVFPISSLTIYLLPQWLCIITLVSLVFYSYVQIRSTNLALGINSSKPLCILSSISIKYNKNVLSVIPLSISQNHHKSKLQYIIVNKNEIIINRTYQEQHHYIATLWHCY